MARDSTKEWIGATDDSIPPPRVRVRVFEKFKGVCQCGCTRKIGLAGEKWDLDHAIALINGGENRESNLQPLIDDHHKTKTKKDVAEKAIIYRKKVKHYGIKKRSSFTRWRRFDGSIVIKESK